MRLKEGYAIGVALLLMVPASAHSQTRMDITVIGSTTHNFNRPDSNKNQYRVYDVDAGSLDLDLVSLSLSHEVERGQNSDKGGFGYQLTLDAGQHIPYVDSSSGLAWGMFDLRQAYLSYVAPLKTRLEIDLGKFVSPIGYEAIEGHDDLEYNASRSYLFGYAEPKTLTGFRLSCVPIDENSREEDAWNIQTLYIDGSLNYGWDNSIGYTNGLSALARVKWFSQTPDDIVYDIALSGIIGPYTQNNVAATRSLIDIDAGITIGQVTLRVNADYGKEQNDSIGVLPPNVIFGDAIWKGVAGYLEVRFSKAFSIGARAEVFDDPYGARTGTAQTLHEYTLSPSLRVADGFVLRSDLRYDISSVRVFQSSGTLVTTQPTVSLSLFYDFNVFYR